MVDALAAQANLSLPDKPVSGHRTIGPAGGQFDLAAAALAAPTRRTLTWFKACCDPCKIFAPPSPTTKQDGCPPAPPVSILPNC